MDTPDNKTIALQLEIQKDINNRISLVSDEYFQETNKQHEEFQVRMDELSDEYLQTSKRRRIWAAVCLVSLLLVCFSAFFLVTHFVSTKDFTYQWFIVFLFFVVYFFVYAVVVYKEKTEDRRYRNLIEQESMVFRVLSDSRRYKHHLVIDIIIKEGIQRFNKLMEGAKDNTNSIDREKAN